MSQLVSKALSAGLGTVSGNYTGDNNSYVSQIEAEEQAQNNKTASSLGQNYASDIDTFVSYERQAKGYVDSSLTLAENTNNTYQNALSYCSSVGDTNMENQLASAINTTINPLLSGLEAEDASTTAKYNALYLQEIQASAATSSPGLQATVGGVNGGSFTNADFESTENDYNNTQNENTQVTSQTQTLDTNAATDLQQCQAYAQSNGISGQSQ